jgi:hypothetical protein
MGKRSAGAGSVQLTGEFSKARVLGRIYPAVQRSLPVLEGLQTSRTAGRVRAPRRVGMLLASPRLGVSLEVPGSFVGGGVLLPIFRLRKRALRG